MYQPDLQVLGTNTQIPLRSFLCHALRFLHWDFCQHLPVGCLSYRTLQKTGGPHARLGTIAPCRHPLIAYKIITIILTSTCSIHVSDYCFLFCAWNDSIFILQKKIIARFKNEKKKLIHHTHLQENDDLPLWRAPAIKKNPHFLMCTR